VVVDLTNDLGRSFSGGNISLSSDGRVKLDGIFLQVKSYLAMKKLPLRIFGL
jgi:hypothetical protein